MDVGAWATIHLSPAVARQLQGKMLDVLQWLARQEKGETPYMLALLLGQGDATLPEPNAPQTGCRSVSITSVP